CPPGLPICVCGAEAVADTITRKALTPSPAEVDRNPRSASTKLRAARRIDPPRPHVMGGAR
ncbi:MAG: S-adenosyl-methyltransferase MraW, partial [Thermoleophilia bacterium]|nr:S-adenosyl-methyltransferase MraW [Thermoleophilia bacterium]